jgi:predicted GNAT family acetyltransferase
MPAHENLSDYQFRYRPTGDKVTHPAYWEEGEVEEMNEGYPNFNHEIQAYHKPTKSIVGRILYDRLGPMYQVDVDHNHGGRGVAKNMVKHGQKVAEASGYRIPRVMRGQNETDQGEAWANRLQKRGIL